MGKKFILSFDLGTTANKVFCFDEQYQVISSAGCEHRQIYPRSGWVEHDPLELWNNLVRLTEEAITKGELDAHDVLCIGITNQRETVVVWDRHSGKPLYNAIVWQCRRSLDICENLKQKELEHTIREKTGLLIDPYFSGTKLFWLKDFFDKENIAYSDALFGTIDSWILYNLTGKTVHATDHTNASRTLLYNIKTHTWDKELIEIFRASQFTLPSIQPSASLFGKTRSFSILPDGVPITGICGDQQSAMVGQFCVEPGSAKNTYGTGCFLLQNTGSELHYSKNSLITTICVDTNGNPVYGIEGSIFTGGAVVQWLRDNLAIIQNAAESEKLAQSSTDDNELVFIPSLAGLGAPYWRSDLKGVLFGITRDTSPADIARAALKGVALRCKEVLDSICSDSGKEMIELKADGGATANRFLMQFQSDIIGIPVVVPGNAETTALGAAYLAGIGINLYKSVDEIKRCSIITTRYVPAMDSLHRDNEISKWNNAMKAITGFTR